MLIIDSNEVMQQLRTRLLRSRGVHVQTAKSVAEAESLWVPDFFDLVLLDVRQRSKEAVAFWRTIRRQHPGQRMRFLVGPPKYLSPTCGDEVIARDEVLEDWVQRPEILHVAYPSMGFAQFARRYLALRSRCRSMLIQLELWQALGRTGMGGRILLSKITIAAPIDPHRVQGDDAFYTNSMTMTNPTASMAIRSFLCSQGTAKGCIFPPFVFSPPNC